MSKSIFDRRSLLVAGGQAALLAALAGSPALAAAKFTADPFSMGVASGDPWPDGFVIWTRLAPNPLEQGGGMPAVSVKVGWEVAEDDSFRRIVRTGVALARPELGHAVHVELEGLNSHRRYWYRFTVDGITSDVGTARTAPAPGATVDRVRMVIAGCQNYQAGLFTAWRHIAQEADIDFVYHYGDYIYEGKAAGKGAAGKPPIVRRHRGEEIYSLDDYRQRYALYKIDPDLRAAHASAAFLASFDDHEVDNNWISEWDDDTTPPEVFLLRRAAAMQAWYEHMPVRRAQFPHNGLPLAYRRLDFGKLMRVHVLDKRSYRSVRWCEEAGDGNCVDNRDVSDSMLGGTQERWLTEGLGGGSTWNIMGIGGLIMPFDRSAQKVPTKGYDNWNGYPDARERLVNQLQERKLTNAVFVGGDSHMFFIGNVPSRRGDMESAPAASELHATSISSNSGNGFPVGEDPRSATNPHIATIWDQRGYLLADVDAKACNASLRVIDTAYQAGGKVSTHARFVTTPERPGVAKA
jgi:alkaline phosphatase D